MNEIADNTDLKERFALNLLLRHGDALEAARDTMPDNTGFVMFIATNWAQDLYVLQCKQALLDEHGAVFFLPSRYDVAHKIMQTAERAGHADDRLKALKLYAELMGFIEKGGVNVTTNVTNTSNKVMIVTDHGTDDEWEAKLVRSQQKLIADARH